VVPTLANIELVEIKLVPQTERQLALDLKLTNRTHLV